MVWQLRRAEWFVSVEHSKGWGHAGGPTRARASRRSQRPGWAGWFVSGSGCGVSGLLPTLPRCRLRCRLCPERWSCWCPGCFDAEPSSVCAKMALVLGGSLARTHPPPRQQICLSLSPVVSECRDRNPQMPAWAQTGPWSQLWSPLPKPTYPLCQGTCLPMQPRLQSTALAPHPAGYEETLTRLAAILAKHFADTRIVGTGEVPYRGLGGVGMGWHLWLAIFCTKC